jgi:hypothetical protein
MPENSDPFLRLGIQPEFCHDSGVPKTLSREQLQSRKEQAVRFTRDVLGDSDRADEIADESLDDYAERRKIQLTNRGKRRNASMATKQELLDQIADLEEENQTLQDRIDAVADLVSEDGEPDDEPSQDEEEEELD